MIIWGWSRHGHKKLGTKKFWYCPWWSQLRTRISKIWVVPGESMGRSQIEEKRLIYAENCQWEMEFSRKSCKKLPRNWGITKNLLRRNRSCQTIENWWINCLCKRRGTLLLWVSFGLKFRIYKTRRIPWPMLWSWISEQLWSVTHSQPTLDHSEPQRNA